MRKRRADNWPLQANDLPPERVTAADPRLRGLADNPVFRLIILRQRDTERGALMLNIFLLTVIPAIFLSVQDQWNSFSLPWVLVWMCFIYTALASGMATRGKQSLTSILGLPRHYLVDLMGAGYPAEEFAAGLWGSGATRRGIRYRNMTLIYVCGLTALCAAVRPWTLSYLGLLAPLVCYWVALGMFAPYPELPVCLKLAEGQRSHLEARLFPWRAFRRALLGIARTFLLVLLFLAFLIAAGFFVGFVAEIYRNSTLSAIPSWILKALRVPSGMVTGAAVACCRGFFVRNRMDSYFSKLTENIREILKLMEEDRQRKSEK